jgi:hypothetical protein
VDEIDTTPREEPHVTPNTASAPVFSLDTELPEKKPEAPVKKGWWQRAFRSES